MVFCCFRWKRINVVLFSNAGDQADRPEEQPARYFVSDWCFGAQAPVEREREACSTTGGMYAPEILQMKSVNIFSVAEFM